jgi:succinoglycan biosynthesis protein ExoA
LKFSQKATLIVVPTLNEQDSIRACLYGLYEQAPKATIVVVDGKSTDRTQLIVRELMNDIPNLKLLENDRRIQSSGVNLAVSRCGAQAHEILIRCDAHAVYPPDFITKILNDFNARDIASVVVSMDATGHNAFAKGAAWIVDTVMGSGGAKHRGGYFTGRVDHGHHAGMRLDWFRSVGGYDTDFSHNEDAEYDYRVTRAGGKIWMNGEARISYQMRGSLWSILRQYFNYGRGRARTCAKHGLRPKFRQSMPTVNLFLLVGCLVGAILLPWLLVLPVLYLFALIGVSLVATIKLRNLSGLWAGPALAAMHNAWAAGFVHMRLRGDANA